MAGKKINLISRLLQFLLFYYPFFFSNDCTYGFSAVIDRNNVIFSIIFSYFLFLFCLPESVCEQYVEFHYQSKKGAPYILIHVCVSQKKRFRCLKKILHYSYRALPQKAWPQLLLHSFFSLSLQSSLSQM